MRTSAAFVIVALLSATIACAAEPKTPDILVGRWAAVKMQTQGELVSLDELQLELEFTPSQLSMRMYSRSEGRTPKPTHVFDCFFKTQDGLLMLDLKTAADSPGPETGLHVRAIFDVVGDTLRICSGHSEDPKTPGKRPKEFVSSPENRNDLYVLRRVQSN